MPLPPSCCEKSVWRCWCWGCGTERPFLLRGVSAGAAADAAEVSAWVLVVGAAVAEAVAVVVGAVVAKQQGCVGACAWCVVVKQPLLWCCVGCVGEHVGGQVAASDCLLCMLGSSVRWSFSVAC